MRGVVNLTSNKTASREIQLRTDKYIYNFVIGTTFVRGVSISLTSRSASLGSALRTVS